MADLYLTIAKQPASVIDAIVAGMDARAADPEMRRICDAYLSELPQPGADVLEIGCGAGSASALMLETLAPRSFTGIDPSPALLDHAAQRFAGRDGVRFQLGDAVSTGAPDAAYDLAIAHTVYSHLPDPDAALAEAFRVLKPGGVLAIFDGDYATNTVALFEDDPLQAAMALVRRHLIHAPYVMRGLPARARRAGFAARRMRAHGYAQTETPDYLLNILARGVDAAHAAGEIGAEQAQGFKAEAARRVEEGAFYGAILFVSLACEKPA